MQKTVIPTTKKLIGMLAVIGLMSVVLAKFFSDLAFADGDIPTPQSLAGDSKFLGIYEVNTVVGNDKYEAKGNLCKQEDPQNPNHSIPQHCHQKVWVYEAANGKLVLMNAVDQNGLANDRIVCFGATGPSPLIGKLSSAEKLGVFGQGVISQSTVNVVEGASSGKEAAFTDTVLQPFFGDSNLSIAVAMDSKTIQVREILKENVLLFKSFTEDQTSILTPVTTPAQSPSN